MMKNRPEPQAPPGAMIACHQIRVEYVGETGRTLRERFNDHRADVRLSKRTNVAVHFDRRLHSMQF